ncbi:hypothetical protein Bca52824_017109 [Brassica carinata]|uniref:Uncharacterized protein n=1 Tax=Brassica carinata TaxID=52824 RepID=A0A8X8AWY5_BRACI|nr:hypothetical protein Bca52824_017109 [Brassica carinata]
MISKVPAKGIARKGRSIADRRFWAGRGHYASQVSKKELKYDYEKGVFRGTVASGRAFIMEFKTNAYSIRWDEEGSPDIWRWNYYDIVAENKKKQQEEEDEAEEKRKEAEKRKQEDEELEADERRTEEERKRAEKQRKKEYAAWIAAEKLRLQIIYETTKEADLEELLTFCRQYHRDMISKVPAKGIARKGRSIADRSFWAGRGHYVSQRLAPPRETSPLRRNYREHLCRNLDASHRQQMEHATPWPTGSHDFPILITAPVFPLVIFFIGRINRRSEISSPSIEHPPERKPSRKSTPSNLGQNILPQTGSQQRIPTNTARTKN